MKYRVHVLCDRFTSQNSAAILAPLIRFKGHLREQGVDVRLFFAEGPDLADADTVVLVDRYVLRDPARAVEEVDRLTAQLGELIYFDTDDSSGLVRADVLARVRAYFKPFLLRDRNEYLRPHYGGRLFTDYYHRNHGVEDREPQWSQAVQNPDHLKRLRVGWSPAIYRYDVLGNRVSKLYCHVPLPALLRWPGRYHSPSYARQNGVSCRISVGHSRESVVHQRRLLKQALQGRIATDPIPRRAYARELKSSRAVLSPFGWGEFALRDYETFVAGAALIKPSMSHLETWPDLYQPGRTVVALDWNLSALSETLDMVDNRPDACLAIATAGQHNFRAHCDDGRGFAQHVVGLLEAALCTNTV